MNVCFSIPSGKKTDKLLIPHMEKHLRDHKFTDLHIEFFENSIVITKDEKMSPEEDVALYLAVQECIDDCCEVPVIPEEVPVISEDKDKLNL